MAITPSRSIVDHFFATANAWPSHYCFGFHTGTGYDYITYEKAAEMVHKCAHFLREMGLVKGDHVAILSENRYEWAIFDLAVLALGGVTVPIYTTMSTPQIRYMLTDAQARFVLVSNVKHLRTIEEANVSTVQNIITLFPNKKHPTFEEAIQSKSLDELPAIPGSSLCSIVYTSGTTGTPKGVMLTHTNFLSNIEGVLQVLTVNEQDTCLSFLPLSHVLERMGGYYLMLCAGATICYARSADTLAEDMAAARPTVMIAVPRLYEKMYNRIRDALDQGSKLRRDLFEWALNVGKQCAERQGRLSLWLRFKRTLSLAILSPLRKRCGGRLRFFVCGGAPLGAHLGEMFLYAGIPIVEGYGLTETSPVLCVNRSDDPRFGTVGKPLSNVSIMLAADGEIMAKGPNVSAGYWKKPKETRDAFDKKGYFRTADIGRFDEGGNLIITDRKKDLIVLSNGKKVAPQPIEQSIIKSRFITQCILYGEKKSYLVALVVPDWSALQKILRRWNLHDELPSHILADERVVDFVLGEVRKSTADFARFEQIKKVALLENEFDQIKGELTPTLKMKRPVIYKNYAQIIERLYR